MCGISAVIDPGVRCEDNLATLMAMHAQLAHRGPDGEGVLLMDATCSIHQFSGPMPQDSDRSAALRFAGAFRWLKIQDLDPRSIQPFASTDGRQFLFFNGEIYNHRELRAVLANKGFHFTTESDTETLLAAYGAWGHECFKRLRGMWAILIVDLAKDVVIGSRDRLGIKPLFWSLDDGRWLFASEAKAVAGARREGAQIDPASFHEFMCGQPARSDTRTFFANVSPVPAGTWFELPLHREKIAPPEFQRFWDLREFTANDQPSSTFEAACEEFESLLRSSMSEHREAKAGVGSLLSGGMDTSVIARLLAEMHEGERLPKTYSIIFRDPAMSEWPYMQLVLAQGGLEGRNLVLTPEMAWGAVDSVVAAQGQPLLGQDAVAQWHAYKLAHENSDVVVLDGQGSDEILAGLPTYEARWMLDLLHRGRWLRLLKELQLRARFYGNGLRANFRRYVLDPWRKERKQARPPLAYFAPVDVDSYEEAVSDVSGDHSALNQYLYRLVRHTNLPGVLIRQDHSSMAHGVESRVPFLDHRIVEFCFRLPAEYKIRMARRKAVLYEAARKLLPPAVVERKDKKMFVSQSRWMGLRENHAEELREMTRAKRLRQLPFVEESNPEGYVEDFIAKRHDDEMAVWRLYTAWRWMEQFGL